MIKPVLIVLLMLYAVSGYGQNTGSINAGKIDSLQNLVNINKKDDTTRINLLHDLARVCFYDFDYKRGAESLRAARQLSQKINYSKNKALYLRTMGALLNQSPPGLYYDYHAKWLFRALKQRDGFEDLHLSFPRINTTDEYMRLSQKKLIHLQEGLAYAGLVRDNDLIASFLIAIAYAKMPQWAEATEYADKAFVKYKQLNQDALAIFPLLVKNFSFELLGKKEEAKEAELTSNSILARIDNIQDRAILMSDMSAKYIGQSRYALGIEYALKANTALEAIPDTTLQIQNYRLLGLAFRDMSMSQKSVDYYENAIRLYELAKMKDEEFARAYYNTGFEYVALKEFDKANTYFLKSKTLFDGSIDTNVQRAGKFPEFDAKGQLLMGKEKYKEALAMFLEANKYADDVKNGSRYINLYIAQCYQQLGMLKESIVYGEKSYLPGSSIEDQRLIIKVTKLLYEVYDKNGQSLKAFEFLKKYNKTLVDKNEQDIANNLADAEIKSVIEKSDQEKQKLQLEKLQKEKESKNQRGWLVSIGAALILTLVLLYVLNRNNKNKQRVNEELRGKNIEIQNTLGQLRSTQSQLIQSEKMASLGELTAGIAHEIQNPLNFVNNFSEVNKELIEELKSEKSKVKTGRDEKLEDDLLNDISQNLEKINHHGKRAGAIVKGMLQHSRSSSGAKEPTDINALADEYLRLAYHGLRAKDHSFNVTIKTDFDKLTGNVNIIPQDIGRVVLNLINNAFYAAPLPPPGGGGFPEPDYKHNPTIWVSTKKLGDKVLISVRDNGPGITQKILDKIFQPFFTTKPTGQGTGLGLSLSYDIVKAHGGELKVETKDGEGSTFIIQLPT